MSNGDDRDHSGRGPHRNLRGPRTHYDDHTDMPPYGPRNDQPKSWFKDNSTLIYFLIAQLIAIGAGAASILSYSVRLETRVHILETRGAAYSVKRMDDMSHQIAVLEQKIENNETQIRRIVEQYLRDGRAK